jgi:DNA-directed RNA polymerase specialized sigma24 family protein
MRAIETWPHRGVPENPRAWLMQVARNRALDRLRVSAPTRESASCCAGWPPAIPAADPQAMAPCGQVRWP